MKGKRLCTIVTTATRTSQERFASNVLVVQILIFVLSVFLLELRFILIKAIIHIGLWLVTLLLFFYIVLPSSVYFDMTRILKVVFFLN